MGNSSSARRSQEAAPPAAQPSATPGQGVSPVQEADSACPVPAEYRNPAVYNVYGQRVDDQSVAGRNPLRALQNGEVLDPRNNMPLEPNQLPCPGQRKPLVTERVASTIPKGGTNATWLFPSPQMVFNALRRKGKGEDVTEDDMESFVHAHNGMGMLRSVCMED
mmetsp:Transcript_15969/g.47343  ORF Transcript_15969/g.47343 Transcript_15969/m.47343 type:complete len:164 (-) Transcript_15969:933-1424(-)|eukprot:364731-Chlamydomonas_euryale.AAC.11